MAGDDDPGAELLDLFDAGDPLQPLVVIGEGQPLVDAVVGDVAGDDGIQAGDVDEGRRCGVGLGDGDDPQLVAFQVDHVAVEGIGHDRVPGDLPGEERVPELHRLRAELPLRVGDDGRRGDSPGAGERIQDRGQAEEVIAVAVGDVDLGEVLPGGPDPLATRAASGEVSGVSIKTASRSPLISETAVGGQVASPLPIGGIAR